MALPPEARKPKPKKKIRRTRAPSTTDRTSPTPSPPPRAKKGPPSPQRTGKATRPQPVVRKRDAAPTTTDRTSDAKRPPAQKRRDKAVSDRNIREARIKVLRKRSRPLSDRFSVGGTLRAATGGATPNSKRTGRVLPGAQAQPLSNLPVISIPNTRAQDPRVVARKTAPVLKVLDQTTRPLHGVAAGSKAAIEGKNVPKAALRGVQNKDKSTFSDVLAAAGVKNKAVKGVVGFGLDVALDPTTYVTGGTGSVVRKVAVDAARKAEKRALAQGLTAEQAKKMGVRAAKQAARKAPEGRGVTLKFAGREAPGVRKATAKVGSKTQRATDRPKVVRKTKDTVRHVAADFNPQITPDSLARETYREVRRATRTARSSTARDVAKVKLKAEALRKSAGKADREILDAIESGALKGLSPEKRATAKRLRDQFKYARRLERRAGIPVKERKGYVPHALKEPLEKGEGIQSVGAKTISPGFSKGRKIKGTLKEIRKSDPDLFSDDAALIYANRMIESAVASNKGTLNRRLLDMGRRLKKGSTDVLDEGEAVVHIKGSNIRVLDKKDKAEVDKFLREGTTPQGGQYVILNEQTVKRAIKQILPSAERSTVGRHFDNGKGGWKWLATVPNPGFHIRNLVGDAQNAYLAENAGRLVRNTGQAARALKRVGVQEEALRKGVPITPKTAGVKIGGKKVSYDSLVREAEKVGAIRAGFINREIPDLVKAGPGVGKQGKLARGAKKVAGRPGRSTKRFLQNREDLFRLATYISGRKRGLSPEKAAERSAKYHFDYADLTELERKYARRLMPFYTFSARNIPLQLTSFFAKPGKYAQYQKIREEVAKAFGVDLDEAEAGTADYEQRSAPVFVKWKGKEFTLSFGPSGLPLTDLNEMPVSTNPAKTADEWMERAMSLVTPAAKTPVELWSNFSFFFRDQIERETGPLVGAPAWVKGLPKKIRDDLGVVEDYKDPRSGKPGLGWPAKVDYVAHILPGPLNYINRVTTASDRKGQGTLEKSIAYGGLRVAPVDRVSTKLQGTYEARAKVGKRLAAMRQRANKDGERISADNPTPEYERLLAEHKRLTDEIERLRVKRGDKIVPRRGRPKSESSETDSFWGSGSSDSSFWD